MVNKYVQLRSVFPAMPVKRRNNLQNFKNADSKKQWIHFVNRKDWIATKHSVLCELHFVKIFTVRWKITVVDESCTHCLSPKTFKWTIYVTNAPNYLQSSQKKILPRWIVNISTTWYNKYLSRFKRISCTIRLSV